MKYHSFSKYCLLAVFSLMAFTNVQEDKRPRCILIGDSTVKNGKGKGDGNLWGWGSYLGELFDSNQIVVENHALGGTSSRTFQTNGLWEKALARVRKGDYVIMQFGHNDSSPLDDTARARGTIKGIGPETKDIYNPIKKIPETVHSYGWYLNKFVTDIQQKGATAIICSPIPRNDWKEGKVNRANTGYGLWAKQVAEAAKVPFIELNGLIADNYDVAGQEAVKQYFTEKDHTHTNDAGAKLNARIVADAIKDIKETNLKKYLLKSK